LSGNRHVGSNPTLSAISHLQKMAFAANRLNAGFRRNLTRKR